MTTEDVRYEVDGVTMIGRLALPAGDDPRPGVLVAHEGRGLDDFQKTRASRFAELGYVAFALDYLGGGRRVDDLEEAQARLRVLGDDPDRARAVATSGLDVLRSQPRTDSSKVAAIGYCFGGTLMLELARTGTDLKAVVGLHPGLITKRPEDSANIVGSVLVCVGTEDPFIPLEHRQAFDDEMRAAGVDWRMNLYGGVQHSFTHPEAERSDLPGLAYDRRADERSWRAMLDALDEAFA